jgi:hypothetical protein
MPPRRQLLIVVLIVLLPALLWLLSRWVKPAAAPVDIAAANPAWTISVTGIPGEVAAGWIWPPCGTLLTNLTLPVELRLASSSLFVQASNRPGSALKLSAVRTGGGEAMTAWTTTTNSCVTLISTVGRVIPRAGGFFGTIAPFGSRPAFEHPFSLKLPLFEPAPEFPAAASR